MTGSFIAVEIRLKVSQQKSKVIKATWKVDWHARSLTFSIANNLSAFPQGACLAGCLIGAGIPLARCLMKK